MLPDPVPNSVVQVGKRPAQWVFAFMTMGALFTSGTALRSSPGTAQLLIAAFFGKMLVSPLGLSSYPHEMHLAPKVSGGSHRRNIVFKQSEEGVGKGRVVGVMVFFLKVT